MTKENKSNYQKIKDTLRWLFSPIIFIYKKFKSLPVSAVGVTTFLIILLLLTAIFNWFWTGTGVDPTRKFYAPFTTNFNEFKDYATLYIALLAFGATMFAGLAVFLVFNDWKEQHNTNIEKEYLKEIFDEFRKYNTYVIPNVNKATKFITLENNFKTGVFFEIPKNDIDGFIKSYNHLITILAEYKILVKDKNINDLSKDYDKLAKNTLAIFEGINNLKVEIKRNIYGEIDEYEQDIEIKRVKALRDFLMKEQALTLNSTKKEYTYWQILDMFKAKHNSFYTYLLENKLRI